MKMLVTFAFALLSTGAFAQMSSSSSEIPLGSEIESKDIPALKEALVAHLKEINKDMCIIQNIKQASTYPLSLSSQINHTSYKWYDGAYDKSDIVLVFKDASNEWYFTYKLDDTQNAIKQVEYKSFKIQNGVRYNEGTLRNPKFVNRTIRTVVNEGSCFNAR